MDANLRIREAMKAAVSRRGLTHAQLANRLGIKQPSVTQLLNGSYGKVPKSLLEALDALGLELQVVESGTAERPEETQAKAEAMALLSMNPWGKKPKGLDDPITVDGPLFEEVLKEHRGPEL